MRWLDEAVADGTAATAGHPSREALFDAVHEDRAGPVECRLLELTAVEPASVRLNALQLVYSLVTAGAETWDAAAQASYARLMDEDEAVRGLAAKLLPQAGRPDLALAALYELTDPAVRTVLAMGVLPEAAERLRHDGLPAVRFLARLSLLREAPPEDWARLDAALLADAEEAARHVPWIGERWSDTLSVLDREADTYALVGNSSARSARSRCSASAPPWPGRPVRTGGPRPWSSCRTLWRTWGFPRVRKRYAQR
ncbi:hypothetical protein OHS70_21035 [Streptomyces sp. NBC_00390]|uniref:hypothetical protein n=1 Tax=Streptomyces sp. NBC_00390 TaxID=2975736 RepID=UPI002E1E0681